MLRSCFIYSGTEGNKNILSSYLIDRIPEATVKTGWLGKPGATNSQISRLEAHLNVTLPNSYKSFLQLTNGWQYMLTLSVNDIRTSETVDWFKVENQDWIDMWKDVLDPISDEEHIVYGDAQIEGIFKADYLQNTIQISEATDLDVFLLNPSVINKNGEWEAWALGKLGAVRYPSFWDLMQAEYKGFVSFAKMSGYLK